MKATLSKDRDHNPSNPFRGQAFTSASWFQLCIGAIISLFSRRRNHLLWLACSVLSSVDGSSNPTSILSAQSLHVPLVLWGFPPGTPVSSPYKEMRFSLISISNLSVAYDCALDCSAPLPECPRPCAPRSLGGDGYQLTLTAFYKNNTHRKIHSVTLGTFVSAAWSQYNLWTVHSTSNEQNTRVIRHMTEQFILSK